MNMHFGTRASSAQGGKQASRGRWRHRIACAAALSLLVPGAAAGMGHAQTRRSTAENADAGGMRLELVAASEPASKPSAGTGAAGKRLAHDPVEDDPRHASVFQAIDDEVKRQLADHPQRGQMGFVHIYWETKKRLLRQKYGIDWRSPGEMNPHVIFD